MVLTGGYGSEKKAQRYNENGFVEALPNLNKESAHHSCASYINNENKRVNKYCQTDGRTYGQSYWLSSCRS